VFTGADGPGGGGRGVLDLVEDALELGQLVAVGLGQDGIGIDLEVVALDEHRHHALVTARLFLDFAVPKRLLGDLSCPYHKSDANTAYGPGQAGTGTVRKP
jgi:hypothetical protein